MDLWRAPRPPRDGPGALGRGHGHGHGRMSRWPDSPSTRRRRPPRAGDRGMGAERAIAAARMRPLRVPVVQDEGAADNAGQRHRLTGRLPFRSGTFGVVTSRPGAFAANEVARMPRGAGGFIRQQVDGHIFDDFCRALELAIRPAPSSWLTLARHHAEARWPGRDQGGRRPGTADLRRHRGVRLLPEGDRLGHSRRGPSRARPGAAAFFMRA